MICWMTVCAVVFPQELWDRGLRWALQTADTPQMAMLGLGDIVIPGVFIALLLRFDHQQARLRFAHLYFHLTYLAYIAGLLLTIAVMHVFKHAQVLSGTHVHHF